GGGDPLARLPDRAESRDVHCRGRGGAELHRRHGLRGPRPTHQIRGVSRVAIVNHEAELSRAGAHVQSRFGALLFFARRYPLGAIGAVIMLAFVATAAFADVIANFDPMTTNARESLAPPGGIHPLGADFMGRDVLARIIYGARISLAVGVGATL